MFDCWVWVVNENVVVRVDLDFCESGNLVVYLVNFVFDFFDFVNDFGFESMYLI